MTVLVNETFAEIKSGSIQGLSLSLSLALGLVKFSGEKGGATGFAFVEKWNCAAPHPKSIPVRLRN